MFIKIHIVQKDDTLDTIMKKYDMTQETIRQANPQVANMEELLPGMKVMIPSKSKSLRAKLSINKKEVADLHQSSYQPTDAPLQQERQILYAHPHGRPIGTMIYDEQRINIPLIHTTHKEESNTVSGICCHCHRPIHFLSPPHTSSYKA